MFNIHWNESWSLRKGTLDPSRYSFNSRMAHTTALNSSFFVLHAYSALLTMVTSILQPWLVLQPAPAINGVRLPCHLDQCQARSACLFSVWPVAMVTAVDTPAFPAPKFSLVRTSKMKTWIFEFPFESAAIRAIFGTNRRTSLLVTGTNLNSVRFASCCSSDIEPVAFADMPSRPEFVEGLERSILSSNRKQFFNFNDVPAHNINRSSMLIWHWSSSTDP